MVQGVRLGLLTQLFLIIGFFGALFLFGWLFPYVVRIGDSSVRPIVNGGLVLLCAGVAGMYAADVGAAGALVVPLR